MAVYIPAGRRRRRLLAAMAGALAVGLLAGGLIGRFSAPDVHDSVKAARARAHTVVDLLDSLPSEYEATRKGAPGKSDTTIQRSIGDIDRSLAAAIAKAPWLGSSTKRDLGAALSRLRSDAAAKLDAVSFAADVRRATGLVSASFGIS